MTREDKIREIARKRLRGVRLILEDIHDPHNAAAIMRTCDALGIQEVWLVFAQEKAYNPRRVGKASSSSANKWLSFKTFKSTEECIEELQKEEYVSIGTVLQEGANLNDYNFAVEEKIALWVGNEHRGLSPVARSAAKTLLTLPMQGFVESLNVSVATALFLYKIAAQRSTMKEAHLAESEVTTLANELLLR